MRKRMTSYAKQTSRVRASAIRQRMSASRSFNRALAVMPIPRSRAARSDELRVVDVGTVLGGAIQLTQISTTATFQLLNTIQTGAAVWNRLGNKIHVKSLHFRGQVVLSGKAGAGQQDYLRIILLYDRQPATALPAASDVLLSNAQDGALAAATAYDSMNPGNFDRFKVLRDIRINIPFDQGAAVTQTDFNISGWAGDNKININEFIPLNDVECVYRTNSNPITIADVASGAIYLMTLGRSPVATNSYALEWQARLRFRP